VLHEGGERSGFDREVLEVLGKQLGTGLENVQLYAEQRTPSARAEVLRRDHGGRHLGQRAERDRSRRSPPSCQRCSRSTAWPAASSTRPATTSRW
jgi:GAF domain-containing protein